MEIVSSRDDNLTEFGKKTLSDRYLSPGENYQDLFSRVAKTYGSNPEQAQRLYDYMSKLWFMPSTPVLANGGAGRGLPISCFLNCVEDTLPSIIETWGESSYLSNGGGGIGTYWGKVREIGARAGRNGKTSGIMPFLKVQDSLTLAVSQGSVRNGSSAVYLPVWHPEIMSFIDARRPTGGDPNRKTLNLHQGICIDDKFMKAVDENGKYSLVSPWSGQTVEEINARDLWIKILEARMETGEPYIFFSDNASRGRSEVYKKLGLEVLQSNLCSEIFLSTGVDHLMNKRTAVCCLSSLNLSKYDEWSDNRQFIHDVVEFLDNVLEDFIRKTEGHKGYEHARYSAMRERSIGLGVMGLHSLLQQRKVPFDSAMAKSTNMNVFRSIRVLVDEANAELAARRGPCPDAEVAGVGKRFANTMAIAPTASISIICGGVSPSIEPWPANVFVQKTLSGTQIQKNPELQKVLAEKGMDTPEVWKSIEDNHGSVQHLSEQLGELCDVFKTAYELDQNWIVELAADRQQFIDQGQSVNLFFTGDSDKKIINSVYFRAWKKGLKSLYYQRSTSVKRAKADFKMSHETKAMDLDECLACQ